VNFSDTYLLRPGCVGGIGLENLPF